MAASSVDGRAVRRRSWSRSIATTRVARSRFGMATLATPKKGDVRAMELEATIRIPVAGTTSDVMLQLQETTAGRDRAAFGGTVEKAWLHDLNLARVTSLRLVAPEPLAAVKWERWERLKRRISASPGC